MSLCDPQPNVDHCRCWWQAEEACCWCGDDGDDFVSCTPIAPVEHLAATPFEGDAPGTTAGAGHPSTPAPAVPSPWDVDSIEAEAFGAAYSWWDLDERNNATRALLARVEKAETERDALRAALLAFAEAESESDEQFGAWEAIWTLMPQPETPHTSQ